MESMAPWGCQNLYLLSRGCNTYFMLVLCLAVSLLEFCTYGDWEYDMQMEPE